MAEPDVLSRKALASAFSTTEPVALEGKAVAATFCMSEHGAFHGPKSVSTLKPGVTEVHATQKPVVAGISGVRKKRTDILLLSSMANRTISLQAPHQAKHNTGIPCISDASTALVPSVSSSRNLACTSLQSTTEKETISSFVDVLIKFGPGSDEQELVR
jgi:hypothetical protein